MSLWRLYYHLVWATKNRESLINIEWEPKLYAYIIGKADSLKCIIHAADGTDNHIHLVASIPPTMSIAEFVKNIKGSSTRYLNQELLPDANKFAWQAGYGVFSLGGQQLERAVKYVQNQKIHHAQGSLIRSLEESTNDDNPPARYPDISTHLPVDSSPYS
jgi:putative transposase